MTYNTLVGWSKQSCNTFSQVKGEHQYKVFSEGLNGPKLFVRVSILAYTSKQNPSRSLSRCLLKPFKGTVSLIKGLSRDLGSTPGACQTPHTVPQICQDPSEDPSSLLPEQALV